MDRAANGCRVVLGTFDGVHKGHRALFARAKALSLLDGLAVEACVIDRPSGAGLCTPDERVSLLRRAGAEDVFLLPLQEVRDLSCEEFVTLLRERRQARQAVCGYNFTFGKDRAGDAGTLCGLIPTEVVPACTVDGDPVSATAIRALLAGGRPDRAAGLLGRPYAVAGEVIHGARLGGRLGFPTANVVFPEGQAPVRYGVYCTRVHTRAGIREAVTNVGVRPTVGGTGVRAESYLFDCEDDLYGSTVRVEFLHFLREERRFACTDALSAQMRADADRARAFFAQKKGEV